MANESRQKSRCRSLHSMIELMFLILSLAIATVAGLNFYRSWVNRNYEREIIKGLSVIKIEQDKYYAKHARYAGGDRLLPATDQAGLGLTKDDFPKLRYIEYNDFLVSVNYPKANEFLIIWFSGELDQGRGRPNRMGMDHHGNIYDDKSGMPAYPHAGDSGKAAE